MRGEKDYDSAQRVKMSREALRAARSDVKKQRVKMIREALRGARAGFKEVGPAFLEGVPPFIRNTMPPVLYMLISTPVTED